MKSLSSALIMVLMVSVLAISCQGNKDTTSGASAAPMADVNPPAEGFDLQNSDPEAIEIADKVMQSMGGRQAWDNTRYLSWNFFGSRHLIWDKQLGKVRIEFPEGDIYLVDINHQTGKVLKNGVEVTHPDSLKNELSKAERIWINDSYWLVMPFKLKDSGVTLKYQGIGNSDDGTPSHILKLTFKDVGVTPQNMYLVYVDTASNLVNQWAFYRNADQDSANFVRPWGNYQEYHGILLSDHRGERNLSDVQVHEMLPPEVFNSLEPVEINP